MTLESVIENLTQCHQFSLLAYDSRGLGPSQQQAVAGNSSEEPWEWAVIK